MDKRKSPPPSGGHLVVSKKPRTNAQNNQQVSLVGSGNGGALIQSVSRTSGLQAPNMHLTGHSGEIFASRFDPTGQHIASASFDRSILLWNTYNDCSNYGIVTGHKAAILDVAWSRDSKTIYSASADTTLGTWDVESGKRVKKHVGHEDIVNTVDVYRRGNEMLVSGSDDGWVSLWDSREKLAVDSMENKYPVTAVAFSEAGDQLFTGGLDNTIKVWDMRTRTIAYTLQGHTNTITSLSISPSSSSPRLLSYSMDSTLRIWDIAPFTSSPTRLIRTLTAPHGKALHGFEKNLQRASWSADGKRVGAGGSDGVVYVWESESGSVEYALPGHSGCVNDVQFSPIEPIVMSASTDRKIILGEIR
ncbi:WD40 repeat-like protein [Saitoella complicata NRRL Y-17804]|uniref:Uncharacterized protein n=1 Tax=Saitoella complicata (strain BCRC 22490 / CBS 7301 / JCM 7358 / NBRC 10748 / NRRL Y-17804) TaxID=698492 RepID=A0A0E9NME6_SAICN|nr:WD40 repeat-like protein [Saitoella complicata NRRL Y-17804]ODQ53504.1 WD40 repeat-like protein [Saitoella complicata NRRL Y-17804]GAO51052.1 hypothetical protein G7K_5164-t1 [Saitoella complicata NRRL Y-17804]